MTKQSVMTAGQLIARPLDLGPHVVLLGAGASRASFPNGDKAGRSIPLMNDLVKIVGLRELLDQAIRAPDEESNFEILYDRIVSNPECAPAVSEIERRVEEYFSDLSLPEHVTIYDRLLLSLRSTDAVFTFNWDPFLFDAHKRNRSVVPLPQIFFLHGNVRVGMCLKDGASGEKNDRCPQCQRKFDGVRLLYPIKQKDYAHDPYIRSTWESANVLFKEAFTLTIFGYGAPYSDIEAVKLLKTAWFNGSLRQFEHVQIIDIAEQSALHARWSGFTPTQHYDTESTFENSRIARWPRRSGESLFYPMSRGLPCQAFPLPKAATISELQKCAATIAQNEGVLSPPK